MHDAERRMELATQSYPIRDTWPRPVNHTSREFKSAFWTGTASNNTTKFTKELLRRWCERNAESAEQCESVWRRADDSKAEISKCRTERYEHRTAAAHYVLTRYERWYVMKDEKVYLRQKQVQVQIVFGLPPFTCNGFFHSWVEVEWLNRRDHPGT